MLVVWDLKCSCWQFSLIAGHCGALQVLFRAPTLWAWRLRVLPYVGPWWCQQQMCWTVQLKPWILCRGRGFVHGLLAWVESFSASGCANLVCLPIIISTCVFVCQLSDHVYICQFLQYTCILILVWISMENIPDCNGSHLVMLLPCLSSHSTPSSHTGGIWNLLAAESHQAIKPSKAHKRTRGRTSNNAGPTSCQQTQRILNLNKPHCSFFILAVSLYVSPNYSSLSLFLTNTTWEWVKAEFYVFTPTWNRGWFKGG